MSRTIRARLARLEAQVKPLACPVCHDGGAITIHTERVGPDGEATLDTRLCRRPVHGVGGKEGARGPISSIVLRWHEPSTDRANGVG